MIKKLKKKAKDAATFAYAPYSSIKVGAAILLKDGRIFSGCNVENVSYGGTICAERTAIVKGVSEGLKPGTVQAICLYTKELWYPCGICLQFMVEFLEEDTPIHLISENEERCLKFKDLFPNGEELLSTYKNLKNN